MFRYLSVYKVVLFNVLIAASFLIWKTDAYSITANIFCCIMNISFLGASFYQLHRFVKRNSVRLFIGRKRTLIVFSCSVFFVIHTLAIINQFVQQNLLTCDLVWAFVVLAVRMFEGDISIFLHKILKRGRRIAVVGNTESSLKIANKLKKKGKYFFYGRIDFNAEDFSRTTSLSPYIDIAKKNQINEFYFSLPDSSAFEINTMAEEAEKHCIKVNFIANESIESPGYRVHYISGMPVLKKYNEPLLRLRNQTVKRTFDIMVSGFVIVFILSWLVPLVGLITKFESKGPVFFRQQRSGMDNNPFMCLKFRSMRMNEHSNLKQATKNDTRITKTGRFLRKTSIDELPQFINVFKGDMSIIGPRPHMLHHTEEYNRQVNNYMARLYLKPGITGWAQANGYRGEIKEIELMKKRVEHDIWYMENWTLMLDIKILWLTFVNILKNNDNAY